MGEERKKQRQKTEIYKEREKDRKEQIQRKREILRGRNRNEREDSEQRASPKWKQPMPKLGSPLWSMT